MYYGLASDRAADRHAVLTDARTRHPYRFGTTSAPKILDQPDTVWINRPAEDTTQETDTTAAGLIHLDKFRPSQDFVHMSPHRVFLDYFVRSCLLSSMSWVSSSTTACATTLVARAARAAALSANLRW
jgi:hypothetical protein